MSKWDETEEAKKYRQNYRKINYDTLSVDLPKGLKELFYAELKKSGKTTTEFIIDYLYSKGYTEKQIENYVAQSKRKAEVALKKAEI